MKLIRNKHRKDRCAVAALTGHAAAASEFDLEYSAELAELARRSGVNHPNCKTPN